jgi:hypothetical protein
MSFQPLFPKPEAGSLSAAVFGGYAHILLTIVFPSFHVEGSLDHLANKSTQYSAMANERSNLFHSHIHGPRWRDAERPAVESAPYFFIRLSFLTCNALFYPLYISFRSFYEPWLLWMVHSLVVALDRTSDTNSSAMDPAAMNWLTSQELHVSLIPHRTHSVVTTE